MDSVLIRYHEIALKKGNRAYFTEMLKRNILASVKDLGAKEIRSLPARLVLTFRNEIDPADAKQTHLQRLRHRQLFSSPTQRARYRPTAQPDPRRTQWRALHQLPHRHPARRQELPAQLARDQSPTGRRRSGKVGARVDLTNPEFTVYVEILPKDTFFGFNKLPGAGGLPVGASGRLLSLISGGFDSPVAAYRMMQRGCRVIFVHFHSAPYQDKTSQDKVRELVKLLTRHQFQSRLYMVPFGEIQRQIVAAVARPLRVVLYRRMMLRIGENIARKEKARALVTGESLGQVASQTLENMTVIQQAVTLPILRPLVGMDKQEIVDQARRIGTFETSSIPDQDCCQLFVPKHPATKARFDEVEADEAKLDVNELVRYGLENASTEEFVFPIPIPDIENEKAVG